MIPKECDKDSSEIMLVSVTLFSIEENDYIGKIKNRLYLVVIDLGENQGECRFKILIL